MVEQPVDMVPIERTREFRGLYHVLGGALSPLDGVDPADLHVAELLARVAEGIDEVIVATNPTMTGEATALYIADLLPAAGARHAPGERAAGGRRPRVRRRADARAAPSRGGARCDMTRLSRP